EAFIYATDRDGWVNTVLKGLGSVTLTWIPKGFPGYDPDETRFAFDPEKAKATLAESDWVKAGKPLDITFTFSDSPRNRTRFEFLANRYQEVLGIQVKLNPVEPTTYSALTKDKATIPQVFYLGWCSDYPDPQNWLSIYWMSTSEYAKRYGYANPELDVIMQNADSELDPAKRAQYYMDAQRLLIADRQLAFLFNSVSSYLVKPWVKGIQTTPQDGVFAGDVNPLTITIEK
ncbi:MAG: peptide ABC transporter substrate-binding protein, partial [Anaerolineaceae bacterium]|nr:peptide ABC transporter substrate-binding protein [Anaerolineaceae bacterium]